MSTSLDFQAISQKITETHQQHFELIERHRLLATHPLQSLEDLRPFHEPACQGPVERRQTEGLVVEDFDQDAAGPEQNHRAELDVDGTANDQFIALPADHGLDSDALEMYDPVRERSAASGVASAFCRMRANAWRTAASSAKFSWTPPASLLWVMV